MSPEFHVKLVNVCPETLEILTNQYNILLAIACKFFMCILKAATGTPGLEFTWLPDDLYCANKSVHKKGGELAEGNVFDSYLNISFDKYLAACSSYEALSRGSFAFRVREGSDLVEVQTFDVDSRLHFVCMTDKTTG